MTVGQHAGLAQGVEEEPALLAVLAVVTDYASTAMRERLRSAWYPDGDRQALEDCLGAPRRTCSGAHACACTHMP
jgi:hypothetical protein